MTGQRSGLQLARAYHDEVVGPLLRRRLPDLAYAAARVGDGSDVLGLDDELSRDHDWGLRLQVFAAEADRARVAAALADLPAEYDGLPTRLLYSGEPTARLGVDVTTVARFATERLGLVPRPGMTPAQWLSVSGQAALEIVAGEVFTDPTGDLTRLREALAWYPDDLWRYVVASDWQRLDQELPLMGRAGDRGDDLGSRVIAARLVDVAVHLAFLLARTWPPYAKWRGTLLAGLPGAERLVPELTATLGAATWRERNDALGRALDVLAERQGGRGLPTRRPATVPFWDRPYLRIDPTLAPALLATIGDPAVRDLPLGVGGIDQQTDNVDVLMRPALRRR